MVGRDEPIRRRGLRPLRVEDFVPAQRQVALYDPGVSSADASDGKLGAEPVDVPVPRFTSSAGAGGAVSGIGKPEARRSAFIEVRNPIAAPSPAFMRRLMACWVRSGRLVRI